MAVCSQASKALLLLVGAVLARTAWAVDINHGKELVEANCFHCHDTSMYTRPARKVKDFKGLEKRVRLCEQSLELQWFDEDIADVAAYLNQNYYKLPSGP